MQQSNVHLYILSLTNLLTSGVQFKVMVALLYILIDIFDKSNLDSYYRKPFSISHLNASQRVLENGLKMLSFSHPSDNLRAVSPCSNTYAGPAPFSEPEAGAVANAVLALQEQAPVVLYLTLHSYSQLWMAPWGWTKHLPRDIFDLVSGALLGHISLPFACSYIQGPTVQHSLT